MGKLFGWLAVLGLCSIAATASAAIKTLKQDGFTDGDKTYFQDGFVAGEAAAVTLGPVDGDFQILSIDFLFGGAAETEEVNLTIFRDLGDVEPGEVLFDQGFFVTGKDDATQEMPIAIDDIFVTGGGMIRVALSFTHDGLPSVARDSDGVQGTNWILTDKWNTASDLGVAGDWVIRATINTQDDGTSGSGGAGGANADDHRETSANSGCSVGQLDASGSWSAYGLLVLAAGAAARRRHRGTRKG